VTEKAGRHTQLEQHEIGILIDVVRKAVREVVASCCQIKRSRRCSPVAGTAPLTKLFFPGTYDPMLVPFLAGNSLLRCSKIMRWTSLSPVPWRKPWPWDTAVRRESPIKPTRAADDADGEPITRLCFGEEALHTVARPCGQSRTKRCAHRDMLEILLPASRWHQLMIEAAVTHPTVSQRSDATAHMEQSLLPTCPIPCCSVPRPYSPQV